MSNGSEKLKQPASMRLRVQRVLLVATGAAITLVAARAADIARPATKPATTPGSPSTTRPVTTTGPVTAIPTAAQQLTANRQAAEIVKAMQASARLVASDLSKQPATLKDGTGTKAGGLVVDPQVLADWKANLSSKLWTGAEKPSETTVAGKTTVSIVQKEQQAVLNWETFNIDRTTTLQFDQSAGGANVAQWIAFNKVGVSGSPSQILGQIQTVGSGKNGAKGAAGSGGQVYVINPNGIIFGGSSQVDTHALVASSLQINDNLVTRGLINNPDSQFLFSSLALKAGSQTPAFSPVLSDLVETPVVAAELPAFSTTKKVAKDSVVSVSLVQSSNDGAKLDAGTDYVVTTESDGKASITLTDTGFVKAKGIALRISYTPSGNQNGDVRVEAGAILRAPTSAEHVGGRIALVGPNVTNEGTLSTPDGQTILAAGLQVGMAAHKASDASLRGLDVYVGAVADPDSVESYSAGTVTNAGTSKAGALTGGGIVEAARGSITLAGKAVAQKGVLDSSTSVSLNGRIDLLADYNAVANPQYQSKPETESPFWFSSTGSVELGVGSLTQILPKDPDPAKPESAVGYQLALPSLVNVRGKTVHFATNSALIATGARTPNAGTGSAGFFDNTGAALTNGVTVNAGTWFLQGLDSATPQRYFLYDDAAKSQIYFDAGAEIDVSGSKDVSASVKENYVEVELRGAELANSPLQRDGVLKGKTITIDTRIHGPWDPALNGGLGGYAWIGTPLADTSGYIGLAKRSVGQLTTAGGTVSLKSGGSVVMQAGSRVDVSGGSIQYTGARVGTTKVTANGHVFDISEAAPDRIYDGVVTAGTQVANTAWGVTESFGNTHNLGRFEEGYIQGASAGGLTLSATSMALDGGLAGTTTVGPLQRTIVPHDTEAMRNNALLQYQGILRPDTAFLDIAVEGYRYDAARTNPLAYYSPHVTKIAIKNVSTLNKAADFGIDAEGGAPSLAGDRIAAIDLNPGIFGFRNFGRVAIRNWEGDISVAKDATVYLGHGGSLNFKAANVNIDGTLYSPGGDLGFVASNYSPYTERDLDATVVPEVADGRGRFTLGSTALLSTAGWVVDDRVNATYSGQMAWSTKGGTVSVSAYTTDLKKTVLTTPSEIQRGGGIDVSGGVLMGANAKATYGDAGKISIQGGSDPTFALVGQSPDTPAVKRGALTLDATLQGLSGTNGGTLEVAARSIFIGPAKDAGNSLALTAEFFNQGGFSRFKLSGVGETNAEKPGEYVPGVSVGDYVLVSPRVANWRVSGAVDGSLTLASTYLEAAQQGPVSLEFLSEGIDNIDNSKAPFARGDIVIGANSKLILNPNKGSSLKVKGRTVDVLGSLFVPGGSIAIEGSNNSSALIFDANGSLDRALPTVHLGGESVLSTAGATVAMKNALGYLTGSVLAGGTIRVSGNIVAEGRSVDSSGNEVQRGAIIDVSGASGILDFYSTQLHANRGVGGLYYQGTKVESDAGTISLSGGRVLWTDANLVGKGGGDSAVGGNLEISSGRVDPFQTQKPSDVNLIVTKSGSVIPQGFYKDGKPVIGNAVAEVLKEDGSLNLAVDENGAALYDLDSSGNPVYDLGHFSLSSFEAGKFEKLSLKGNVKFSGSMNLVAKQSLSVASGGFLHANGDVKLTAPYVALGTAFRAPFESSADFAARSPFRISSSPYYLAPTYGSGSISVSAKLIDVGNISLQGIGRAALAADQGDIRGNGTLDIAGALTLKAGQVYPTTASEFNIAAYDYVVDGTPSSGSVTVKSSGSRKLPWSAAGHLNIYASEIVQEGTLRAPFGSINLGWDGTGTAPLDTISGKAFATAKSVTLATGSETSVSGVEPGTGKALVLPYGFNANGTVWYDPAGNNITLTGVVNSQSIKISGATVKDEAGSKVDISGGGDLFSYRFVTGTGGTKDVLNSTSSYAILPDYSSDFAPSSLFNETASALSGDNGYASKAGLAIGDRVYLGAFGDRPAGYYTLLPARYALLPGAYLVTEKTSIPNGTASVPDGSYLVSGYRFNGLNPVRTSSALYSTFEVASGTAAAKNADGTTPKTVVRSRAQYDDSLANTFFSESAQKNSLTAVPNTPKDSGQLVINASESLTLQGRVLAKSVAAGGRGGLVDISSSKNIEISNTEGAASASGSDKLVLDSRDLSSFGADSLLIGGVRTRGSLGTQVAVTAGSIVVDNKGTDGGLKGNDVVLVANGSVEVKSGSIVAQAGSSGSAAENLVVSGVAKLVNVGDLLEFTSGGRAISLPSGTGSGKLTATVAGFVTRADGTRVEFKKDTPFSVPAGGSLTLSSGGSLLYSSLSSAGALAFSVGDGAMIRVNSNTASTTVRAGVTSLKGVAVTVGEGATVTGGAGAASVDSTSSTLISSNAVVDGNSLTLSSGQISMKLSDTELAAEGLVLTRSALDRLAGSTKNLSLSSYSTIDLYGDPEGGAFGGDSLDSLSFHSAQFRGFAEAGGSQPPVFTLSAKSIQIDNDIGGATLNPYTRADGSTLSTQEQAAIAKNAALVFSASNTLFVGRSSKLANQSIDQFGSTTLQAGNGLVLSGAGSLNVGGNLLVRAPKVVGTASAKQSISAAGALVLEKEGDTSSALKSGLGANLSFAGASVLVNTAIEALSGKIDVHSTGSTSAVTVGGSIDVSGFETVFQKDAYRFTNAGSVTLRSDFGDVTLLNGSRVKADAALSLVSGVPAGTRDGSAGLLAFKAPEGKISVAEGTLSAVAGRDGKGGMFSLDVAGLNQVETGYSSVTGFRALSEELSRAGISERQALRFRQGDVRIDGDTTTHQFSVSADAGTVTLASSIDAGGATGGAIDVAARDSVVVGSTAKLSVRGVGFDAAGKGGSITLEAGAAIGGEANATEAGRGEDGRFGEGVAVVDIRAGAQLDLSVEAISKAADPASAKAKADAEGKQTGVFHLRAPQTLAENAPDVQINALPTGTVIGASSIEFEGFKVYQANDGKIDSWKDQVESDGFIFAGAENAQAVLARVGANLSSSLLHLQPGAEIVNYSGTGDLTLANDWDLSLLRYGTTVNAGRSGSGDVGILTLRASGNLIFNGALSDGFLAGEENPNTSQPYALWQERLLDAGSKSWSYRLAAGADARAAHFDDVIEVARDAAGFATTGSLKLGKTGSGVVTNPGANALTVPVVTPYYQVIRTGTGNIDIATAGDVQLLNQFATIYSAGSQVADPTLGGAFETPVVVVGSQNGLGAKQQTPYYSAQYAYNGGNVFIRAGGDIARLRKTPAGVLVDDSSQEMPNNWLYRRGNVDSATGKFARHVSLYDDAGELRGGEVMSTSWWIDYSNFFEGVAALGGGNVTLDAAGSVRNVDALVPTNARMPGVNTVTGEALKPDASTLVELGGGNLVVRAGNNIDGGVYYVEKGKGSLVAGGSIKTNSTRDPSLTYVGGSEGNSASERWLPTTLFLGKGQFSVTANEDLLLGPVANTFLLPQGVNNSYWYKSYFSTYGADSAVTVASLNGTVRLRENSTTPLLADWFRTVLKYSPNDTKAASTWRPWLRLAETEVAALFDTASTLLPPTLNVTAFGGDLNTVGKFTLSPSAVGSLDLVASGSINALQSVGAASSSGNRRWAYSTFNLSDADPASIAGVASPLSLSIPVPTDYDEIDTGLGWVATQTSTQTPLFGPLDRLFDESGSVQGSHGVLQSKQALHAASLLHYNDPNPVRIYAGSGDISGLELYSGKPVRLLAGQDITDIGLYIQNLHTTDSTVVAAGRDMILFAPNSPLRLQALSKGNVLLIDRIAKSGDVQISGPGSLEVYAGRNLDLGAGRNATSAADLNVGITSVGDVRNPFLRIPESGGASIVVGAGLGGAGGLSSGDTDFSGEAGFVQKFLNPEKPGSYATRYLPKLAEIMGQSSSTPSADIWAAFSAKPVSEQNRLALSVFYLVLRDAGRDFADPKSNDFGTYNAGYNAVATLFHGRLDFAAFEAAFLNPTVAGKTTEKSLVWLNAALNLPASTSAEAAWSAYSALGAFDRNQVAAKVFDQSLSTPAFLIEQDGKKISSSQLAISSVFKTGGSLGDVALSSREVRTKRGGSIQFVAPFGGIDLGSDVSNTSLAPPGVLTEFGGSIGMFARDSISVGTSRVFTLRGGDEILWSSVGDIGAGRSSKTVKSAPPTQVKVDPQSADVATDIAGLATGGGIGVLAAVADVKPGNVDLIAPAGTVDAGDAGIRSTGNLNIAALHVVNAGNISVSGASSGGQVQAAPPSLASVATASNAGSSAASTASEAIKPGTTTAAVAELPSLISVEVLGYGGDDEEDDKDTPSADRLSAPQFLSKL